MHTARKWFQAPCMNNIPFSARAQCPGTGTKSGRDLMIIMFGSWAILRGHADSENLHIWCKLRFLYIVVESICIWSIQVSLCQLIKMCMLRNKYLTFVMVKKILLACTQIHRWSGWHIHNFSSQMHFQNTDFKKSAQALNSVFWFLHHYFFYFKQCLVYRYENYTQILVEVWIKYILLNDQKACSKTHSTTSNYLLLLCQLLIFQSTH